MSFDIPDAGNRDPTVDQNTCTHVHHHHARPSCTVQKQTGTIANAKRESSATDMGLEPTTLALGGPRATIAPTGQR
jgi:hypothetical protein